MYCSKRNAIRTKKLELKEILDSDDSTLVQKQEAEKFNWTYFIDELKANTDKDMDEAEKTLYAEHKITEDFFNVWMEKYEGDAEVEETMKKLYQIQDDVFSKEGSSIEHFVCNNIP